MKNKIILCAFASPDLILSAKRVIKQAKQTKIYDDIKICSINDLTKIEKNKLQKIIKKEDGKRGYGYWFWKPLIIKKLLSKMKKGDILHYVDVGCHIELKAIERLNYYIKKVIKSKKGILAFQFHKLRDKEKKFTFPVRKEYMYTKSDLLKYFKIIKDKKVTHTPQFAAGCIFFKKNNFTLNFVDSWSKVFKDNLKLVDDSPSKIKNFKGFIEHRHDQSVFSILCKKKKIERLSAFEVDWVYLRSNNQRTWEHNSHCPVLLKRDLKYNLFRRFLNRQRKTLNRLSKRVKL